ncbi:MAG TPA: pyridoxal-phosphate dependent enzyme [Gemmatimonadaceae bacterium]|nr:pyridoxal-phosphate dependent enzyme [Gemmatimonadaceae bacterium]
MSRPDAAAVASLPLYRRFPPMASLPRVVLGTFPTPVQSLASLAPNLWVKRDDLCAEPLGGNKARALEFLLARVRDGDRIVTVGAAGSTHALAVATYGARLGARVEVGRWRQFMNPMASRVAARLPMLTERAPVFRTPLGAYAWAWTRRARGARWVAAGGSTPRGILGHVNAGLEFAEQLRAGALPMPASVVLPLGTGGTMAGLALAFAIAELPVRVVGARVVPRIVGRVHRVHRLANATARLIERTTGERVARPRAELLDVVHDFYGGAYGRETAVVRDAASAMRSASGVVLDSTYSGKAFALALELAKREPTLFWLTFDSRTLSAR